MSHARQRRDLRSLIITVLFPQYGQVKCITASSPQDAYATLGVSATIN
jgi:hypothetical protein